MRPTLRWVRDLPKRPEVWAIAEGLGADRRIIACAVMALAEYLDCLNPSGEWFVGVTREMIDVVSEVEGFADCAVKAGLILYSPAGMSLAFSKIVRSIHRIQFRACL